MPLTRSPLPLFREGGRRTPPSTAVTVVLEKFDACDRASSYFCFVFFRNTFVFFFGCAKTGKPLAPDVSFPGEKKELVRGAPLLNTEAIVSASSPFAALFSSNFRNEPCSLRRLVRLEVSSSVKDEAEPICGGGGEASGARPALLSVHVLGSVGNLTTAEARRRFGVGRHSSSCCPASLPRSLPLLMPFVLTGVDRIPPLLLQPLQEEEDGCFNTAYEMQSGNRSSSSPLSTIRTRCCRVRYRPGGGTTPPRREGGRSSGIAGEGSGEKAGLGSAGHTPPPPPPSLALPSFPSWFIGGLAR